MLQIPFPCTFYTNFIQQKKKNNMRLLRSLYSKVQELSIRIGVMIWIKPHSTLSAFPSVNPCIRGS